MAPPACASPLIGASILSPGQQNGSLLTVSVGSAGQLVTLQPGTGGNLLGQRAGGLNSGGATAHDDDTEVAIVVVHGSIFKLGEELVAQAERLRTAVQRHRELFGTGDPEEVGSYAGGDDEVVILHRNI